MIALPYLSAIRFSDTDAGDFLQNQLSADVLALENGESTFACYCEPKGRVLALMLVCRVEEDYYALLSNSLAQTIVKRLRIYVMRSKVSIDVLDDYTVSGIEAKESPGSSETAIPIPGVDQYFLLIDGDVATAVDETNSNAWRFPELQRGITWLSPETSGEFLPQMLGFDQLGAVNFRKGCYPGQEIVARTHYLGKVKRHPRVLNIAAVSCPDLLEKIQIISGGETYGAVVTDCVQGPDGVCLIVVTRMDPDLVAEKVEYGGETVSLL